MNIIISLGFIAGAIAIAITASRPSSTLPMTNGGKH